LTTKPAFNGSKKKIELLIDDDGTCEADAFINALDAADRRKVDALFELMGEKGKISNEQKFKKLEGSDGIFEFKSFQIRLLCFHAPGQRIVICRGLIKKKDKHDKTDILFAETCRKRFHGENT
jgi:mRNA-degrading endonuclease RelE of RelBE toxin-antitoxin system